MLPITTNYNSLNFMYMSYVPGCGLSTSHARSHLILMKALRDGYNFFFFFFGHLTDQETATSICPRPHYYLVLDQNLNLDLRSLVFDLYAKNDCLPLMLLE